MNKNIQLSLCLAVYMILDTRTFLYPKVHTAAIWLSVKMLKEVKDGDILFVGTVRHGDVVIFGIVCTAG